MEIPYIELKIGTMLYDENIDVIMVERDTPTVYGSSKAYWLIGEDSVLVWYRYKGEFGQIKILSIKDAIEESIWDVKRDFSAGRVSANWQRLMEDNNFKPLSRDWFNLPTKCDY